eukprot:GHVO01012789.1.p1 GENE.GHVO01012789.1~~GHVO01012789.1.p1  ORF type:complete len:393 (+),score=96.27 GHVO01012789.1:28-1206(+)
MRQIHRNIPRDRSGVVALVPEHSEDIWHVYNLIAVGDLVTATTVRKVQKESTDGMTLNTKVKKLKLTVAVERVEYEKDPDGLRISGRIRNEADPSIRINQYHSLHVQINEKIDIYKDVGQWDNAYIERLKESLDPKKSAQVTAVLIDSGVANIYAMTENVVKHLVKVTAAIPKRSRGDEHDKANLKFYESVLTAIVNHIDFEATKCVLIAGPGFVKDAFSEWLFDEAGKRNIAPIKNNRKMFFTAAAGSAEKQSLQECLTVPAVALVMTDKVAIQNSEALDEVYKRLAKSNTTVCCGLKEVMMVVDRGAVQTLLISDKLLRSGNKQKRSQSVRLSDAVRDMGGKVLRFSDQHVSGEKLSDLGGIAAILKFAVHELEDIAADESSSDSNDDGM